MKSTAQSFQPADLLRHSDWVAGLARALVADEHGAEDLAQDTLAIALEHPGQPVRDLRRWLGAVMRTRLHTRRREHARRAEREVRAARSEEAPAESDLAERADQQRLVLQHVLELDLPYREVILMRYFEGATPQEIARRVDLPVDTVKTRLKRARKKLEERLSAEFGGRERMLGVLAVLSREKAAVGSYAFGLFGGALVAKLAVGAAAAAALLWIGAGLLGSDVTPRKARAGGEGSMVADPRNQATEVRTPATSRIGGTAGMRSSVAPAADHEQASTQIAPSFVVRGRCVDPEGNPVAGALVSLKGSSTHSHEDGRFDLEPSREVLGEEGVLFLWVFNDSYTMQPLELVSLIDGPNDVRDLVLSRAGSITGRVIDATGRPVKGAHVVAFDPRIHPDPRREDAPYPWDGSDSSAADGTFVIERVPVGTKRVGAQTDESFCSYSEPIDVRWRQQSRVSDLVLGERPEREWIDVLVLDPAGDPVPDCPIHYHVERMWVSANFSDDAGRCRLKLLRVLPHDFMASDPGGRYGPVLVRDVEPGGNVTLQLSDPVLLRIEVLDPDERPIPDAQAVARPSGGWSSAESIGKPVEPGVLVVTTPVVRFEVEVSAPGWMTQELGPFSPPGPPVPMRVVLHRSSTISGVALLDGVPVADASVSLHEAPEESWLWMQGLLCRSRFEPQSSTRTDVDGRFVLSHPGQGRWYVRVEAGGLAPAEAGPLDARGDVEDLVVRLGAGGTLEGNLRLPPGEGLGTRVVKASRGDGFLLVQRPAADGSYSFANVTPGRWFVSLGDSESSGQGGDHGSWSARLPWNCEVLEGRVTRFDLDLSRGPAFVLHGTASFQGEPVSGWTVSVLRGGKSYGEAEVDEQGGFSVGVQQDGPYQVKLQEGSMGFHKSYACFFETVDLLGESTHHRLDLSTGSISGKVGEMHRSGEPVIRIWSGSDGKRFFAQVPVEDGCFEVGKVLAGEVEIVCSDAHGEHSWEGVLEAGETLGVEFP